MKILHCADIHLDSPLTSNFSPEQANDRRGEILISFCNMIDYASEQGIEVVLICGDLFDNDHASFDSVSVVLGAFRTHPHMDFYYITGNHERNLIGTYLDQIPVNLHLFSDEWTGYCLSEDDGIMLYGVNDYDDEKLGHLQLDPDRINIVMAHGQITEYGVRADEQTRPSHVISRSLLRGRNIDYMALGHLHSFSDGEIDARGRYCYSGCLEGRGFDEPGLHGFSLIDVEPSRTPRLRYEFIPFAQRVIQRIDVDISGCEDTWQALELVKKKIAETDMTSRDIADIYLCGNVSVDSLRNTDVCQKALENDFYIVRVSDRTVVCIDYDRYDKDMSLRGEFVRMVKASTEIAEADKGEIIRCGINALGI